MGARQGVRGQQMDDEQVAGTWYGKMTLGESVIWFGYSDDMGGSARATLGIFGTGRDAWASGAPR
jgi:hypothetical protein